VPQIEKMLVSVCADHGSKCATHKEAQMHNIQNDTQSNKQKPATAGFGAPGMAYDKK
jgi:hypothetical protein